MPGGLVACLIVLAGVLWFGLLGERHLIHPDEGRYAELARGLLATGDWVTPRLNGILYFEKPVLQYWATAAAFAVLGVGEVGARLWPALTGALTIAALWWTTGRTHGPAAARAAAWVLGGSVWWSLNSHFVNLDTGLSSFMGLTLLGVLFAQREAATAGERRAGMIGAWAAMGLAVLSKGLVGLVLPGAVLVVYTLIARDFRIWRRMHWLAGLTVFIAITAPWFVLVSLRNPEFAHFFFVHEHFQRFTTTQHRRTGQVWYFVPILAVGLLPWTTLLPGAIAQAWRRTPGTFQPGRLLIAWCVVIFTFFSASGSKLPSYILPMFPALALLIGTRLAALPARAAARHAMVITAAGLVAVFALFVVPQWFDRDGIQPADLAYRAWLVAGCASLALGGLVATGCALSTARRADDPQEQAARTPHAATAALAIASLAGAMLMMLGHQVYAPLKSARTLVESVRDRIDADAPVYTLQHHDQTLPFYLGRPVILVEWVDEFATGLRIEPDRRVPSLAVFEQRWRAEPGAVAVMRPERHAEFERDGLPMTLLYRDAQRVVVLRPPDR